MDQEMTSVSYGGGDVIIEEDVVTAKPTRLTYTTGIKSTKATRHMSEVYTRSPPNRIHSVPARARSDARRSTRRSISRHGSRINESMRGKEEVMEEMSPYSFMLNTLQTPETIEKYRKLQVESEKALRHHKCLKESHAITIETRAYLTSLERLQSSRVLLITGAMGSGKSHLALNLMFAMQDRENEFHSLVFNSPVDLELIENTPHRAIVLIEHCFGTSGQASSYINAYISQTKRLKRLIDRKRLYLILTSDTDRFEELQPHDASFLAKFQYFKMNLDCPEYQWTFQERTQLASHWATIFKRNIDIDLKSKKQNENNRIGFPALCHLLGIADLSSLFDNAVGAINDYLSRLHENFPCHFILLMLVIVTDGTLSMSSITEDQEKLQSLLHLLDKRKCSMEDLVKAIDNLESSGVLMKLDNGAIQFESRVLYNVVLRTSVLLYGDPLIQMLPLRAINILTSNKRHVLDNNNDQKKETVQFLIGPSAYKSVISCMNSALESRQSAVFYSVASSSLWQVEGFLKSVGSFYGFHFFFIEDSNKLPFISYLMRTGNSFVGPQVLLMINQIPSSQTGITSKVDLFKMEVCKCGNQLLMTELLKISPDISNRMLFAAIENNHVTILDYLLKFLHANCCTLSDTLLLKEACRSGNYNVFEHLYGRLDSNSRSAELIKRDSHGLSLIHQSAIGGDLKIFQFLESEGSKVTDASKNGYTALHYACLYGHLGIIKHMCDKFKSVITIKASHELCCVHVAAIGGHDDVLDIFMDYDIDVELLADGNNTVAHIAAANGNIGVLMAIVQKARKQLGLKNKDWLTPAQLAARFGQIETLKFLFTHGVDPNTKTVDSRTFLHLAAFQGHIETVKYLCFEFPEMYNNVDNDGNMVLHDAAAGGCVDIFNRLVECGLDPLKDNYDGATVLHDACYYGKLEMVKHLCTNYSAMINKLSKTGLSPAVGAALGGHVSILKYLSDQGANLEIRSVEGSTLLHEAAYAGQLKMVEYLANKFPYMKDVVNQRSYVPYHFAAQEGHVEVFAYLLPKRLREIKTTEEKQTPLHIAAYNGMLKIVKFICVKIPAMMVLADDEGSLATHYAGRGGHIKVLDYLIEKGQDPYATTHSDSTLLHLAAFDGNHEMVLHLCNKYPELVECIDASGHSAAHYAAGSGDVQVLQTILQFGVDPMIRAHNGSTLLLKAAYGGSLDMVRYIYNEFPDMVMIQDNFGCGVTHYAACGGHNNILKFALEDGDPALKANDGHTILHVATYHAQEQTVSLLCNSFPELMVINDSQGKTAESIARDLKLDKIIEILEMHKKLRANSKFFPAESSMVSELFCCASGARCFCRKICTGLMAALCCRRSHD